MNPITRLIFALVLLVQIRALAAPGEADPGFVPPAGLQTYSVALQPDGRIIVGGSDRLFTDGTLDSAYGAPGDNIDGSTAIQLDGKVLVATSPFNDPSQRFIHRLNTDDTRDTAFVVPAFVNNSGNIYCTALQDDGRILIGGLFVTVNTYPPSFTQRSGPRAAAARRLPGCQF